MKNTARLVVMDTVWGHLGKSDLPQAACLISLYNNCYPAGGGSNKQDTDFMAAEIKAFLEEWTWIV